MGSVESVKAVSDIYAPVSGEVIEINDAARQRAREAERKPARRWLADQVRLSAPDEIRACSPPADYQKYVAEEETGH